MKVLFICGSLEQGKDGVGDYVRRLAQELSRLGNQVMLVAIKDRFTNSLNQDSASLNTSGIQELRIPGAVSFAQSKATLQSVLNDFKPDWLSIQYVPYSFNKRGITFEFVRQLKQLKVNAKIHIMFHEIWQGESRESIFKDKAVGLLQKLSAKAMIRRLQVDRVSTSNAYYQQCLRKLKVNANVIPVFSNLPKGSRDGKKIYNLLPEKYLKNRNQYILACFFGGFHNHIHLTERIRDLASVIKQCLNKELLITHVGKSEGIASVFKQLSESTGVPVMVLGQHTDKNISDYLQHCDIGLSNHPKILFQKSGSTSALLNSGCPVVILKDSFEVDNRRIKEIEEYKAITEMKNFIEQEKSFSDYYGVETAVKQYNTMFNLDI